MKKLILVLSGPSGVGKSTLISYLLSNLKSAGLTVSHTTRPPRNMEKHGVDYYFVTQDEFEKMVQDGQFIEHVSRFGNRYGTSRNAVSNVLKDKDICILDLEFDGAYNVLSNNLLKRECIGILIFPPSVKALKQRLMNRNTEDEESLKHRLEDSFKNDKVAKYHHIIFNKDIDVAKADLMKIIKAYMEN